MSEPIHKTKGIVLKAVKYGDTSIIATIYTELFGVQSYMVKGIRKTSKKGANNINYFSPSAILDLQVYHNEFKQLQFIKEYKWDYLYQNIYYDVIKNAVAMFSIELLQHSIKQPENNPDLFYFIEKCFIDLDLASTTVTANFPLFFSLKLGDQLGFGIQHDFSDANPILDLQEGIYCEETPIHPYFIEGVLASITNDIIKNKTIEELENLKLNKIVRRQLLEYYIQYFSLHISNFVELKSVEVLKEVLE